MVFDRRTIVSNRFSVKIQNRITNSVDPDETAHDEPSHLDLHCFQKCLSRSTGLYGLNLQLNSAMQQRVLQTCEQRKSKSVYACTHTGDCIHIALTKLVDMIE